MYASRYCSPPQETTTCQVNANVAHLHPQMRGAYISVERALLWMQELLEDLVEEHGGLVLGVGAAPLVGDRQSEHRPLPQHTRQSLREPGALPNSDKLQLQQWFSSQTDARNSVVASIMQPTYRHSLLECFCAQSLRSRRRHLLRLVSSCGWLLLARAFGDKDTRVSPVSSQLKFAAKRVF